MSSNSWRKRAWYFVRDSATFDDIISWMPRHYASNAQTSRFDVIKCARGRQVRPIWCHHLRGGHAMMKDRTGVTSSNGMAWRPRRVILPLAIILFPPWQWLHQIGRSWQPRAHIWCHQQQRLSGLAADFAFFPRQLVAWLHTKRQQQQRLCWLAAVFAFFWQTYMGKPQYEAKVKEALTIPPSGPVFKGFVMNLVSSSRKKPFFCHGEPFQFGQRSVPSFASTK